MTSLALCGFSSSEPLLRCQQGRQLMFNTKSLKLCCTHVHIQFGQSVFSSSARTVHSTGLLLLSHTTCWCRQNLNLGWIPDIGLCLASSAEPIALGNLDTGTLEGYCGKQKCWLWYWSCLLLYTIVCSLNLLCKSPACSGTLSKILCHIVK